MSTTEKERSIAYARDKARLTLPVLVCVMLAVVAMYLPIFDMVNAVK